MFLISVLKFTPQGLFLEEYESVTDAAKSNTIHRSAISKSASGERKLGGGYLWRYRHDIPYKEYIEIVR